MTKGALPTKLKILTWGDFPGLPLWTQCNYKNPRRGKKKNARDMEMLFCWFWRWKKEPRVKECRWPQACRKGNKTDANKPTDSLILVKVKPVSDIWPLELQDNNLVLFYTTKGVGICYSSNSSLYQSQYQSSSL